jgi:hypothetical protein
MDDQRTDREGGLTEETEWIIAVEPMLRTDAEISLAQWLQRQAELGIEYAASEIREDLILSNDRKTLIRYAVPSKQKYFSHILSSQYQRWRRTSPARSGRSENC